MRERDAVDISGWEPWQRDYRYGVILVMPPPHVAAPINALRETYDPKSHAICSAHISVSDPLSGRLTDDAREEIQHLLATVHAFDVHYEGPTASAARPGVTCHVSPQERFDVLKRVIHQASVFSSTAYGRRDIPAHLTIAEFLTIEESLRVCVELARTAKPVLRGSFRCDRLDYLVPDVNFRFQRRGTFFLGRTCDEPGALQ